MQVVALAHGREVAVDDGRLEDALGLEPVQPVAQPRPALGLHQLLVRRALAAAGAAQPPLAEERRPLVEQRGVVGERDALDHPRCPRTAASAPGCRWRRRSGRPSRPRLLGGPALGAIRSDRSRRALRSAACGLLACLAPAGRSAEPSGVATAAALDRHQRVHQPQALERVPRVAHVAVVDLGQVVLDVRPGQRGAAEQHRVALGDAARVHLLEVLLHHHGRLHQQPGHADDVGLVLLRGVEDRRDRLLDAEVDDGVAVVGQDDVDQVLADVVHVALDRGEHDACPCRRRRTSPCAARGGPPRSSSPRPTAARTAAASRPSRTGRRRSSCRPAACR